MNFEEKCRLDIDIISQEAYATILKEFKDQHGEGVYNDWELTAVREVVEE